MDIFRKNYLDDMISISSVISVWRIETTGKGAPVPDVHDFWELVYIEKGTFSVFVDGEPFEIGCGEAFLYPPLAHHIGAPDNHSETLLRIISFESDSRNLFEIAKTPLKTSGKARELFLGANEIGLGNFYFPGSADGVRGMKLCEGADVYELQKMKKSLELCLIELLSCADRRSGGGKNTANFKKETYAALNDYLRMNIAENLTLSDMANALSISVSTLKKISAEAFGLSPLSYFISLKLDAAKRMIRESSLNFTEISERLGFGSIHYFSRIFKKYVGLTPSEYAKGV